MLEKKVKIVEYSPSYVIGLLINEHVRPHRYAGLSVGAVNR